MRRGHLSEWMSDSRMLRLFWTFLNQGVVSAGAFVVQIVLARRLAASDYGVFSLILGGMLALQISNATLLFHPMSVRVAAASDEHRPALLGASMILVVALSAVLGLTLAVALAAFGQKHLMVPALAFMMAWQIQEGLRRGLLSSFGHGSAIFGDITTYGGQALMVLWLGLSGSLSVDTTLYAMAGSATLGAVVHTRFLKLALPPKAALVSVCRDYWRIGGTAAFGSGYLSVGRLMVVPWTLAAVAGPAAAAGFQAAMNIVNLSNPLVLGLGNIIPQAAARACGLGNAHAWHVVRRYVLIAAPPIVLYSIVILAAPAHVLGLFYGAGSDYLTMTLPIRLLILVALTGFAIEAVISFLHGITSVRSAAVINAAGTAATAVLAVPLIIQFGVAGGCAALLIANLVRLGLTRMALTRVTAITVSQPA